MKVTAELSLIPIGTDVSLSKYVALCQEVLAAAGLDPQLHANGTNVTGEWDTVLGAVKTCHEKVHDAGVVRINSVLKLATRTDRDPDLAATVRSVRAHLADRD
jgi:uncharacterized protein (TIGR00106 family)